MRDIREKNNGAQKIGMPLGIAVAVICSLAAGASASGYGIIAVAFAATLFAVLYFGAALPIVLACIPASFVAALIFTGDPLLSLSALVFVVPGACIIYCMKTKRSLAMSVTVLTAAFLISAGVILTIGVYETFGSLSDGFVSLKAYISETLRDMLTTYKFFTPDGKEITIPESDVQMIMSSVKMLSPAFAVMSAEIISYFFMKLFFFETVLLRCDRVYSEKERTVSMSRGAALLFLISFIGRILVSDSPVLYYSALNIAYILILPALAVGFKAFFGRNGFIRNSRTIASKVFFIGLAVLSALISPALFFGMIATVGVFSSLGKKRYGKQSDGK